MKRLIIAGALALGACSHLGINLSQLTPRQALAGLEEIYTQAANAANQIATTGNLSAATKAQLRSTYASAGEALNAADTAVLALPVGATATTSAQQALDLAGAATAALSALVTANGGKI